MNESEFETRWSEMDMDAMEQVLGDFTECYVERTMFLHLAAQMAYVKTWNFYIDLWKSWK